MQCSVSISALMVLATVKSSPCQSSSHCPSGQFNCTCLHPDDDDSGGPCRHSNIRGRSIRIACSMCSPGRFSNQSTSGMCEYCPLAKSSFAPAGKFYANAEGMSTCSFSACPAGYYNTPSKRNIACESCPIGYFQTASEQTSCLVASWGGTIFNIVGNFVSFVAAAVVFSVIVADVEGRQQTESRMLTVLVLLDMCSTLFNGISFVGLKASWQSAAPLSLVGQFFLFSSFTWTLEIANYLQNGEVKRWSIEKFAYVINPYTVCFAFLSFTVKSYLQLTGDA